jgi:uncharacterized membrane protein YukC
MMESLRRMKTKERTVKLKLLERAYNKLISQKNENKTIIQENVWFSTPLLLTNGVASSFKNC